MAGKAKLSHYEVVAELHRQYIEEESLRVVAGAFGCSASTLYDAFKRYNLALLPRQKERFSSRKLRKMIAKYQRLSSMRRVAYEFNVSYTKVRYHFAKNNVQQFRRAA